MSARAVARGSKPAKRSTAAKRSSLKTVRWHVYLLRCRDGSLYCGIAIDVAARIAAHNAGKGAKYTRSRRPVELAWTKRCRDGTEARKLEARIKRLSRAEKLALVG